MNTTNLLLIHSTMTDDNFYIVGDVFEILTDYAKEFKTAVKESGDYDLFFEKVENDPLVKFFDDYNNFNYDFDGEYFYMLESKYYINNTITINERF